MKVLLDSNKPFYKANLHCHSTYSDGVHTVEEIKEEFKKRGYSIVAFTDHEHLVDNSRLDDENFLTITSCEVAFKQFPEQSTLKNFDMRVCHLNFYALDQHNVVTPCYSSVYDHYIKDGLEKLIRHEGEFERVYSAEGINEVIRIAKEKGFIVTYNHPTWSLENATHYLGYEGMFAVEIYNTSCYRPGARVDDEHVFDDFLRDNRKIFCVCADDNHSFKSAFGGWVCINAEKLEYKTVMNALQKGDFYASTGPQIFSLVQDGMEVEIQTSACKTIGVVTHGRRTPSKQAEEGQTLTSARFTLRPEDKYFRIRVTDEYGHTAYTQAYPIEE